MKRVIMMSIPALTSVMRKIFWEYAKYFAILLISAVITVGCDKTIQINDENGEEPKNTQTNKENEEEPKYILEDEYNYAKNAKLKRISSIHLGFSEKEKLSYKPFVTNPETIWYVDSEYEYDNLGRISKVSRPMYDNGTINGVISYDIYTYNEKKQLEKIMYYNANIYEGFINLWTRTYSYDKDGNKRKEVIVYPCALPFRTDSTIYHYENNRLKREDKYEDGYFGSEPWRNKHTIYTEYEYDDLGNLVEEKTYLVEDNSPFSHSSSLGKVSPTGIIKHSYQNGLNVKSENNKREIRRYYDKNDNLIYVESQELSIFSSALSYISKYEYY